MNFRRDRKRGHAAVEAASLSDILFFLMLFFLIISTLASPNAIKLLLPKATTGQTVSQQKINVSVTAELRYFIEKQAVPYEGLEVALQEVSRQVENPVVVLRVERTVQMNDFMQVVDVVNRLRLPMVVAAQKN